MSERRTISAGDVGAFRGELVQVMMVLPGGRLLVGRDGSQYKIDRSELKEAWYAEDYPDPAGQQE